MKKIVILLILLVGSLTAYVQDVICTIVVQLEGVATQADSIRLNNLSNGTTLLLTNLPDSGIYLVNLTKGELFNPGQGNHIRQTNAFRTISMIPGELSIVNSQRFDSDIRLTVFSLSGERIWAQKTEWHQGEVKRLLLNQRGLFLVTLEVSGQLASFKAVGMDDRGDFQIASGGFYTPVLKAQSLDDGFTFAAGDSLEILVYKANYSADPVLIIVSDNESIVVDLYEPVQVPVLKDLRDSREYAIVEIGEQTWMAENLAFLPVVNAPAEISYTDARYYVYNYEGSDVSEAKNSPEYADYGVLYNWPAALSACPLGWRLPSDYDWMVFEQHLGLTEDEIKEKSWRGKNEGISLKATSGWSSNGNGTDDYGFAALPGGNMRSSKKFIEAGIDGYWWTASEYSKDFAWYRKLSAGMRSIYRDGLNRNNGFSIRCMKSYYSVQLPEVETGTAAEVKATSAILHGQVLIDGGEQLSARGFFWSATNPEPGFDNLMELVDGGIGTFQVELTELEPNTPYYYRAFASNSAGTAIGDVNTFTTLEAVTVPKVTVQAATSITLNSAVLNGTVVNDGGSDISLRGFYWSATNPDPGFDNLMEIVDGTIGAFSIQIDGLQLNTTYYFRAYAVNDAGTGVSSVMQFKTADDPNVQLPALTTTYDAFNSQFLTMAGVVEHDGGAEILEQGFYWSESKFTEPSANQQKVVVSPTQGMFFHTLTDVTPGQTVWFMAYATNRKGMGYGNPVLVRLFEPGIFRDHRDGTDYAFVTIGEQTWMATNLAWLPQVSPPEAVDQWSPRYYVYNYSGNNVEAAKATNNYFMLGTLYNLPAALEACPVGWHLPSDDEWKQLERFLGIPENEINQQFSIRGTNQGTKLKSIYFDWYSNGKGTDDYGFDAYGSGFNSGGFFQGHKMFGGWWSAAPLTEGAASIRELGYNYSGIRYTYANGKWGYSVRCLKDQ
jgi:uncharacterized protein (TIGR02145 family)